MRLVWSLVLVLLVHASAWAQTLSIDAWNGNGYIQSQLVRYKGTIFFCTGGPAFPPGNICPPGIAPDNAPNGGVWNSLSGLNQWNSSVAYAPNAMTVQSGQLYTAIIANTNVDPAGGLHPETWSARSVPSSPTFENAIFTSARPLFFNLAPNDFAWIRAGSSNDESNLAFGVQNQGSGTNPGQGRSYFLFQPAATALLPRGGAVLHLGGTYWTGSAARNISHAHEVVMIGPTGGAATTDQDSEYQWEVEGSGIFGGATGGLIRFRWDGLPTTNASIKTHSNDGSVIRFSTSSPGGGGSYTEVANMASGKWNFPQLTGGGNASLCVNAAGQVFRGSPGC